ncbi:rRNA methyltransferase [Niallia sp. FSL W8-0635]|uniref:rRNA methyltransferase n=1 Tax=Niallia sp. FSL W8-0635 TaxID=2975337 RepID=UPI0009CF948B|nr:Uncharacterised protein [Mycobacteroides abscessus subsp. abscessus]HEO8419127.1 hypothetical protein [Yersinia enterocolitica]
MWRLVNGKLIQETDQSRVKFRTNISKEIINELNQMAEENDTHINYLIENGLRNLLANKTIQFSKESRPKDRVQYKTTYDKQLLEDAKQFAKSNQLYMNDILEYSTKFIDLHDIKDKQYKNRVERM